MKKSFFLLLVLCVVAPVEAQDRRFGLGVVVGEPTGISAKYWTSNSEALSFGVGWYARHAAWIRRFDGYYYYYTGTRFHIHADYLWHDFDAIRSAERFPLYYGVGARLETGGMESPAAGVRGVFGIAWMPRSTPLDVFVEIAPTILLAPSPGVGIGAGLGVRYFF